MANSGAEFVARIDENRDTAVLRSGDQTRIYKVLDSIVRNTFRKQELISKLRDAGDQIILVERKILEEIAAGTISTTTITGQQFRNRIEGDIADLYNATAARIRALHHYKIHRPSNKRVDAKASAGRAGCLMAKKKKPNPYGHIYYTKPKPKNPYRQIRYTKPKPK